MPANFPPNAPAANGDPIFRLFARQALRVVTISRSISYLPLKIGTYLPNDLLSEIRENEINVLLRMIVGNTFGLSKE